MLTHDLATPSGTHSTPWRLFEPDWLQFPLLATEMRVSILPHIRERKSFPLCCQCQTETLFSFFFGGGGDDIY